MLARSHAALAATLRPAAPRLAAALSPKPATAEVVDAASKVEEAGTATSAWKNDTRFIYSLPAVERVPHMKLLVCDMAGTTVHEGGLVYTTLQKVMNDAGLEVSDEEMLDWHGAQKTEVVAHFVSNRLVDDVVSEGEDVQSSPPKKEQVAEMGAEESGAYYSFRPWSEKYHEGKDIEKDKFKSFISSSIDKQFEIEIKEAYFSENGGVKLIHPELLDFFANMRSAGCKIALNTGYPTKIQQGLLKKLELHDHIDAAVCAGDVGLGRPYPYMVQLAMKKCAVMDAMTVAKAGDTARDMEEGLYGGCGLAVGVLSGAGTREGLERAGADLVLDDITKMWELWK